MQKKVRIPTTISDFEGLTVSLGRNLMLEEFSDESGSDKEDMDEDFEVGEAPAGIPMLVGPPRAKLTAVARRRGRRCL